LLEKIVYYAFICVWKHFVDVLESVVCFTVVKINVLTFWLFLNLLISTCLKVELFEILKLRGSVRV